MRQDVGLGQPARRFEALEHLPAAARHALVGEVLRGMDVQATPRQTGQLDATGQRLVREREAGVAPTRPRTSSGRGSDSGQETAVLLQPRAGMPRAVAVGDLVGEDPSMPTSAKAPR